MSPLGVELTEHREVGFAASIAQSLSWSCKGSARNDGMNRSTSHALRGYDRNVFARVTNMVDEDGFIRFEVSPTTGGQSIPVSKMVWPRTVYNAKASGASVASEASPTNSWSSQNSPDGYDHSTMGGLPLRELQRLAPHHALPEDYERLSFDQVQVIHHGVSSYELRELLHEDLRKPKIAWSSEAMWEDQPLQFPMEL